ncbi:CD209 antigen-like protein A isoform 2-T2 [Clarias gariepinus]|uniref:CD209 antigen-like protein E isoform X2 n=1 Tax=Clarias gariepinus TaxID=13013 RepID=UPI00234C5856|nr:CD209 antigen-like protein E isoform X2 [Clarias gariepinus]
MKQMNENVYANSGTDNRSVASKDSYEDIYVNEAVPETQVTRCHKETTTSGCYRLKAVCVVLLFVLLLTAITVLSFKFITERHLNKQLQQKTDELQKTLDALDMQDKLRWKNLSSSLYYFSEMKNWDESRQDCRERGADLVIINSKEKQLKGSRTWIGLSDRDKEGEWKWVDGTPLTSGNWGPGQPDNFNEEDCAEIGFPDKQDLNDRPCSHKQGWICEKRVESNSSEVKY